MIEIVKLKAKRYEYLKNIDYYLGKIKKIAEKHLREFEMYIFGSFAEGKNAPSSDIDILIFSKEVTPEKRVEILKDTYVELGFLHPFEIHVVDEEGFEFYKKFVRKFKRI